MTTRMGEIITISLILVSFLNVNLVLRTFVRGVNIRKMMLITAGVVAGNSDVTFI
jgi:hypothetical protein